MLGCIAIEWFIAVEYATLIFKVSSTHTYLIFSPVFGRIVKINVTQHLFNYVYLTELNSFLFIVGAHAPKKSDFFFTKR